MHTDLIDKSLPGLIVGAVFYLAHLIEAYIKKQILENFFALIRLDILVG